MEYCSLIEYQKLSPGRYRAVNKFTGSHKPIIDHMYGTLNDLVGNGAGFIRHEKWKECGR